MRHSNKHSDRVDDADFIKKNADLIEQVLRALGFPTRVVEINILKGFYEYLLDVAVGTDLEELEKHKKDLALALASPTGKVYWQIPIPGKALIGLKVPKPSKEFFEQLKAEEEERRKGNDLKHKIAFVFFLIGDVNHYIGRKILGDR
jgi:DNA segregation ATPase FtsK/SpoIIIE-like protein